MQSPSSIRVGLIVFAALFVANVAAALTLKDVQQALERQRGRWVARPNALTALSEPEQRRRLGETSKDDGLYFVVDTGRPSLPRRFDWRDRDGVSYASPILNQGSCGSCVIFATIGTLETQMNVSRRTTDSPWNYSTQHLLSCGGGNCKDGWNANAAANFLLRSGVPDAACFPYTSGSNGQDVACRLTCADVAKRTTRIARFSTPTQSTVNVNAVKQALLRGPVLTTMNVYSDFFYYGGGVYHHVTGDYVAGHAVSIVGWDDDERAWIVRNSWGRNWGDHGYFRIDWNDVSGVGRSSWSFDVGQVDGFVVFGGQPETLVLEGKATLPLRSTFDDLVRIDWTVLKDMVPVASGSSPVSSQVELDTAALPDGVYELRATAVRKKTTVAAQPRRAYVLNGELQGTVEFSGLVAGQTLAGKVALGARLTSGPVPFTLVTFHAKNVLTGEVVTKSTSSIAPFVQLSWRTDAQPDGEYDVWLEASAGETKFVASPTIRVVIANAPPPAGR